MPNPLSVAAGIVGLISFGTQMTRSLVKFYTAYKSQDTDVARSTGNLENLRGTLEYLSFTLQSRTFQLGEQGLVKNIESCVQKCDDFIQELLEECEKFRQTSVSGIKATTKAAGRRIAYLFRTSTLPKL